jgi:transposase InsO family protein
LCYSAITVILPGQPWRNGYIESFNSRVRDECLNINIFWSLAHARVDASPLRRHLRPPITLPRS